jgi:septal ring factor EnvC (AmiA/AmiB activator)
MDENKTIIVDSVLSDLIKWLITGNYYWEAAFIFIFLVFWYKFEDIKLSLAGGILLLANGMNYDNEKKQFLAEIQRLRELLEIYSKENQSLKTEVNSLREELNKTQKTMSELILKLTNK